MNLRRPIGLGYEASWRSCPHDEDEQADHLALRDQMQSIRVSSEGEQVAHDLMQHERLPMHFDADPFAASHLERLADLHGRFSIITVAN